jgi:hypothetical protein
VPSTSHHLKVQVLIPADGSEGNSEAQGRLREESSERSAKQNREPMNKNRIRGAEAGRAGK